ncbi:uncharacterized protein LOC111407178 [Olea europaea var. sylvestris]|uniref:uncharacterized protein LOC111407178 n=1 Tax=Olea europaea var. sylvestris TaxID=158386 RepID=UPI000C1D8C0C|nr:uncharacterized protein LOC111407178 [Olea europaea var. sylvestris]
MEGVEDFQRPLILSPYSNGGTRRRSRDSNSTEFEFWMLRNPSFPQHNLLSADELFSGGVLLPLHLRLDDPPDIQDPRSSRSDQLEPEPEPDLSSAELANLSATSTFTSSKRWKDICKKSDKKNSKSPSNASSGCNYNDKKKEKKGGGAGIGCGSNGVSAAELKINLMPFSRSRSSGNNGSRPRMVAGSTASATRKVSSEPCSRCNSAGESKTSRKWPSSPSPVGVHLARNNPISHVRRGGVIGRSSDAMLKSSAEKSASKLRNDGHRKIPFAESGGSADGGEKAGVLNLNIPVCMGYRHGATT